MLGNPEHLDHMAVLQWFRRATWLPMIQLKPTLTTLRSPNPAAVIAVHAADSNALRDGHEAYIGVAGGG